MASDLPGRIRRQTQVQPALVRVVVVEFLTVVLTVVAVVEVLQTLQTHLQLQLLTS